jgi:hypothetical protein
VAVDVHPNPGRGTRWVVGERRGTERGALGDRRSINPDTMGLPSNHAVPVYSVCLASPPAASRTSVSMRDCGSTSIIVVIGFLDLGLGGR